MGCFLIIGGIAVMTGIRRQGLSPEYYQNLLAQETRKALLHLLEVHLLQNDGTLLRLYYVDDYSPLEFYEASEDSTIIYQPASFKVNLGADSANNTPTVTLNFDSGDRTIIRQLRENDIRPVMYLSLVMVNPDPDEVVTDREIGPIMLEVDSFDFKSSAISMSLVVEPILDEPVPATRFNPIVAPALFTSSSVNG
jgi:hypothetical protein